MVYVLLIILIKDVVCFCCIRQRNEGQCVTVRCYIALTVSVRVRGWCRCVDSDFFTPLYPVPSPSCTDCGGKKGFVVADGRTERAAGKGYHINEESFTSKQNTVCSITVKVWCTVQCYSTVLQLTLRENVGPSQLHHNHHRQSYHHHHGVSDSVRPRQINVKWRRWSQEVECG